MLTAGPWSIGDYGSHVCVLTTAHVYSEHLTAMLCTFDVFCRLTPHVNIQVRSHDLIRQEQ